MYLYLLVGWFIYLFTTVLCDSDYHIQFLNNSQREKIPIGSLAVLRNYYCGRWAAESLKINKLELSTHRLINQSQQTPLRMEAPIHLEILWES